MSFSVLSMFHAVRFFAAMIFCLISTAGVANAQSWGFGLTAYGEAKDGPQSELFIGRQFRPFGDMGKWSISPIVGVRMSVDSGSWVGAGIVGSRNFRNGRWRVEAGLMPGYYNHGSDGRDLGSNFEFRSFLSVGREASQGLYLALGVEHMSNGGIGKQNPGENRLILQIMKFDHQ